MRLPKLITRPYRVRDYKIMLVMLVMALSVIGILVVGSAKESLQSRQIFGVVFGLSVMLVTSFIDYVWILNMYWLIYAVAIGSLAAVLVIGDKVNGARRWVDVGFTRIQPSELAKILLILFFAKFIKIGRAHV